MRWNDSSYFPCLVLAGLSFLAASAAGAGDARPVLRPAPPRPAATGFSSPAASRIPRPAATPGILPAALVGVERFDTPSSRIRYAGPGVWDMDAPESSPGESFLVRWWANPSDIDKSGIVILLSYTLDSAPSRVLNLSRPLPPSARGNQSTSFELPADASRVFSWRAVLMQRGRPLSIMQSPDWNSMP